MSAGDSPAGREILHVPFAYRVVYVGRGHRVPREGWVAAKIPVSLPAPGAVPPVAIAMGRVRAPGAAGDAGIVRETFHAVGGGLSRMRKGLGAGDVEAPGRRRGAWRDGGYPFQYAPHAGPLSPDIPALDPRQVDVDERERAEAHVRAVAERTVLTPRGIAVPAPEPVWAVFRPAWDRPEVRVHACLADGALAGAKGLAATFRADRRDRAVAYAGILSATARRDRDVGGACPVRVVGGIAVRDASLLSYDEVAANAPRLAANASLDADGGFDALPEGALRAWIAFREAYGRRARTAGGGDPDPAGVIRSLAEVERGLSSGKGGDWLLPRVAGLGFLEEAWAGDARPEASGDLPYFGM